MPLISLPEDFDFDEQSHKLMLKADLDSIRSAIKTLQNRLDESETVASSVPLFPARYTIAVDELTNMAHGYSGLGFGAGATVYAPGAGSFEGTARAAYHFSGTRGTHTLQSIVTYTRNDSVLLGYALNESFTIAARTGLFTYTVVVRGTLPEGISGWAPEGIEWDLGISGTCVVGSAITMTVTVSFNGATGAVGTYSTTSGGTSFDTGMQTVRVTPQEFLGGYEVTPGAIVEITGNVQVGYEAAVIAKFGELKFNWK